MVKIDWSKFPRDAMVVNLSSKGITEMNWDHVPPYLREVDLWNNQITKMNWDSSPRNLTKICLSSNQITEMNWKNVSNKLEDVYGYQQEFKQYKAARRIQQMYLRHYTRRKAAARKIVEGCHAWVWKPLCKDGTIGIRPRLDMLELGVTH
jgi:hypothetical protein